MRKLFIFFTIVFLTCPLFGIHAADHDVDLGLNANEIRFSKNTNNLLVGEDLRVYASVYNNGNQDALGYIAFYINNESQMIGSAEVSVLADGYYDEVYVDFTVPKNDFRVMVTLLSIIPNDDNLTNNSIITQKFIVQGDNDQDGIGDDLATDDDNDSLLDGQEEQLGTDKDNRDTDGDGVLDADDLYPLDPNKYKDEPEPVIPEPEPEPVVEVTPVPAPAPEPEPKKPSLISQIFTPKDPEPEKAELVEEFYNSPVVELLQEVKINVQQINWNTFKFDFSTNIQDLSTDNLEYHWLYGDGSDANVNDDHRFRGTGDYFVTLKVKGPFENYIYDNVTVVVAFWSVYNYWLWLIVLVFIALIFLYSYEFRHNAPKKSDKKNGKLKREPKKPKKLRRE